MTQTAQVRRYAVRLADLTTESEAILAAWLRTYPGLDLLAARSKLDSQYRQNPAGTGICLLLELNNARAPIGVQCIVPRRFSVSGTTASAGTLADYVVDPAHRSLGPALTLFKEIITASRRTFSFIYGFPNEKSTVIARRAGMSSPAGITRYVRPLRSQKFIARALARRWQWLQIPLSFVANMLLAMENLYLHLRFARHWSWIEQQDFDAFFDDCWNQSLNSDLLIGERTADSLAWRYPENSMRRISVLVDLRTGRKEGYAVWRLDDDTIEVMDFYCREPAKQFAPLFCSFPRHVRKLGASAIAFEFVGPKSLATAIVRAGYRPRDTHPVFMASGTSSVDSLPVESMYLTNFDRDS